MSSSGASLSQVLQSQDLSRDDLIQILSLRAGADLFALQQAAEQTLLTHCGDTVRLRGLIEFSNVCACDCLYCGIRKSNRQVERYTLTLDEVVSAARWCADKGYGSVVLQSGERRDARFADWVCEAVAAIKAATRSAEQPDGVGITLCVGEQTPETYQRFFDAGAHRYLLRMESSSPELFAAIHPPGQSYAARRDCLHALKAIGFQVGTGVMIGLPGQTIEQLADDLLFFKAMDVDMIGMGPYIPHHEAAMPNNEAIAPAAERLKLALKMIGAARLLLKDVNIAATTALQAMAPDGREQGLRFGANVIMPQVTPLEVRRQYTLYDGKPCLDDSAGQCASCLEQRIQSVGRRIAYQQWGDSAHFAARQGAG